MKKGGRSAFLYFLRVRGAPEFGKYKERDCCPSAEERLKLIVGYDLYLNNKQLTLKIARINQDLIEGKVFG